MGYVSVVIPYAENWYFDTVLDGIRDTLTNQRQDVQVSVVAPGPAARHAVTRILEQHLTDPACLGAIAMHFRLTGLHADRVHRSGKPVVLIGGRSEDFPVVRIDDTGTARVAVQHLIDLGLENIAYIGGYTADPDHFTIRADRARGYSDAMRDAGLETQASIRPSAFEFEAAKSVAMHMLQHQGRPTAVFAVVDEVAFGVIAAARDLGLRIPRDLSIIGIDDHKDATALQLTTMRQNPAAVGTAASARLLGETTIEDQVIPTELLLRTSTGPPPGSRPGILRRLLTKR